jgi:hypothetical protein
MLVNLSYLSVESKKNYNIGFPLEMILDTTLA